MINLRKPFPISKYIHQWQTVEKPLWKTNKTTILNLKIVYWLKLHNYVTDLASSKYLVFRDKYSWNCTLHLKYYKIINMVPWLNTELVVLIYFLHRLLDCPLIQRTYRPDVVSAIQNAIVLWRMLPFSFDVSWRNRR